MRTKVALFLLLSAAIMFTTSCHSSPAETGPSVGQEAKDFTLSNLEGKHVSLSSFRNKEAVMLVFTTTWCYYCVQEIPNLKRINQQYGGKGVKVLAVYIQEKKDKVKSFTEKKRIDYTVLLDKDGEVASMYNVSGIPAMFLIDKDGIIRSTDRQPSDSLLNQVAK